MTGENKVLIGIGVITLILIIGGVIFFSKSSNSTPQDPNFDKAQLTEGAKNTRGNANAPVTIVEFGDIQCPACQQAQPIVKEILAKYGDSVYFVFRHYPLTIHKNAELAAQAAEAAGAQGKFFEMIDTMYTNQREWENDTNPREDFRKYAGSLELNMDQFNEDMEKETENIATDFALGNRAGVQSTPTFFINGEMRPGVLQMEEFDMIIQSYIQASPEATASTSETPDQ